MSVLSNQFDQPEIQNRGSVSFTAKKIVRLLAAGAIVLAGILVITVASHPAAKDYISYWSAGKLLLHHADPYSPSGVFALEKTQGYSEAKPIIMRNPPWALFLTVPIGFGGPTYGLLLWTAALAGSIIASLRMLHIPSKDVALAFVFAPALASICVGQSSPFLLLGFSLFLRFYTSRPFLAGASLLLMAIKPHLFVVFWMVLLIDCIYRRRFLILAGGTAALAAGTAFSMCFNPRIWQQYFAMLRASALDHEFFPTTSMLFRLLVDPKADWLLFVPSALAVFWGLWYYARSRRAWDWRVHGMLLMLVTVMVSPYGWFTDEIVLLPSIAFALSAREPRKYSTGTLLAINSIALLIVVGFHPRLSSSAYLWTPLAWLAWFLYANRRKRDITA
jgi:hypothetical protein